MWSNHDSTWKYEYNKTTGKTGKNADGKNPWEQEFGYQEENGVTELQKETSFKEAYFNHRYSDREFRNKMYFDLVGVRGNERRVGRRKVLVIK